MLTQDDGCTGVGNYSYFQAQQIWEVSTRAKTWCLPSFMIQHRVLLSRFFIPVLCGVLFISIHLGNLEAVDIQREKQTAKCFSQWLKVVPLSIHRVSMTDHFLTNAIPLTYLRGHRSLQESCWQQQFSVQWVHSCGG